MLSARAIWQGHRIINKLRVCVWASVCELNAHHANDEWNSVYSSWLEHAVFSLTRVRCMMAVPPGSLADAPYRKSSLSFCRFCAVIVCWCAKLPRARFEMYCPAFECVLCAIVDWLNGKGQRKLMNSCLGPTRMLIRNPIDIMNIIDIKSSE